MTGGMPSQIKIFKERKMKRTMILAVLISMLVFLTVGNLVAKPGGSNSRFELILGPRVGSSYIFSNWETFNDTMQEMFPDSRRKYIPLITQFGLNVEQRIQLGATDSHFVFQEILVIGGLDQNLIVPSLNALIGFRSHAGLEIGLGPNLSLGVDNGNPSLAVSVLYAIGWTFSFSDVHIPVNIAIVPTPADGHPRLTVITGFNFGL